jgi:hypothetical protein
LSANSKIEEWRPIEGFESYHISSFGRVRGIKGNILKGSFDRYAYVRLKTSDGKWPKQYIHRLVATAFLGPPAPDTPHANHVFGDKRNNNKLDIEWTTQAKNNRHAYRTHLIPSGEKHHWAKLSNEQVSEIRASRGKILQRVLAARFGVTQSNISAIQLGRSWDVERRCAE